MQIKNFPNLRQGFDYDCGATALQSVLFYYGINERLDKIMKLVKTQETGTNILNIKKIAEKYGLKTNLGKMTIDEVKSFVDKKIPVILLVQAWTNEKNVDWENDWDDGHYVIAIGYNKSKMYFEDPSSISKTFLTYEEFKKRWHDAIVNKKYINYGLAIFGKKPADNHQKVIHMD